MTEARPRNVLLIESSPLSVGLIESALPGSPNVFVAKSRERAFSVIEMTAPDIVVMNSQLSGEDGFELLSLLKTDGRFRRIPVIVLSPTATIEEERLALSLGAVDFLPIPFDPVIFAERVRIQIELLQRETHLARVLDSIQAAVVLIDADSHTVERVNVAAAELIGATPAELVGRSCFGTICSASPGGCPITDLGQRLFMTERRLPTAEGDFIDVQKTAMEVSFGPRRLIIETIYDIRELKTIQSALSSMLQEVETITDASANGVRVLGVDGVILRINRTLAEWHECDRNEVVGKLCEEVFGETLLPRELALIASGEEKAVFETELHFDDTRRICIVSASPMRDAAGNVIAVIEDIADVTELRVSEMRTREAMLELNYVLGSTASAIRVIDRDFNVLRVNRSFSNWTGIPEQNLLQLKCFEATGSEICRTELCPIVRIRSGETHVTLETEKTLPSGRKMFCLLSASPYFDSHGRLKGIMEDLTDITRRKALEDELLKRSLTDELTGLYNRRGFFDVAERDLLKARRHGEGASLFFIDLDNLKTLNDTRGHEEGDRAIVSTALILKSTFRKTDVLCRLGGDEFVVFTVRPGEDHFACVQKRLDETIAEYNGSRERGEFRIEMSMGCVLFDPERHPSLEALLAEADALMYEIKQGKKVARASAL